MRLQDFDHFQFGKDSIVSKFTNFSDYVKFLQEETNHLAQNGVGDGEYLGRLVDCIFYLEYGWIPEEPEIFLKFIHTAKKVYDLCLTSFFTYKAQLIADGIPFKLQTRTGSRIQNYFEGHSSFTIYDAEITLYSRIN